MVLVHKHHANISQLVFLLWPAHLMRCCSQASCQYITTSISIMASSLDGGVVHKHHANISQLVFILWPAHLMGCCSQAPCQYITTSISIMASSLDGVLFPSTMLIYHK